MTTKVLEECATTSACESFPTVAAHVDIYEADDAFTLVANLPGVEEKDIMLDDFG